MMKKSFLRQNILILLFFMMLTHLLAQYPNVMISNQQYPEEPSIAIDPANPLRMIAGANLVAFYNSSDGGQTWGDGSLYSAVHGVYGDPCLIVDTLGYYYYFHLANPPAGIWIDSIVCQRSTDGGLTWNDGSAFGLNGIKQQDKEWAVVDKATNTIYVSWTEFDNYGSSDPADSTRILFVRSDDQGLTWTQPKRLSKQAGDCIDSDNTVEGAVPAVGPEGQVYVAWAGPLGIMFDRSYNRGETWLENDIFVSDFPGGWDYGIPGIMRCNGLPVTCCDVSNSAYKGNIYVNWSDQRNGETDTDIWLSRSSDGGDTWSQPIRVNNDPAGKQQFFTWMTVDQVTGYLWFVFYDRRNYSGTNTDVFIALSRDGGETFNNFKISESPFLPTANVFFGDYTNISAHNNVVRPIWARLHNNALSVWTALLDSVYTEVPDVSPLVVSEQESYPNPFSGQTYYAFKLHRRSLVNLDVMDLYGHKVASILDNQNLDAGKFIEQFNPAANDLPSGIYYFRFSTGDKENQRKIVYLR
jgi:hypothetical protein